MDVAENLVAGGYFLVQPMIRSPWMSELLPARISSVSNCICDIGPAAYWGWEAGHWHDETAEGVVWANALGIARAQLPRLREWTIQANRAGDLEFPFVLSSPDVARRLVREFAADPAGLTVLGIAMDPVSAATFIAEEDAERSAPMAPSGLRQILGRAEAPAPGGQILGYEVVGGGHSWICNGLERDAPERFGIRPNPEGFISTREDAGRIAAWANDWEESRAEPEAWWPWLVSRYPLT